MCNRNKRLIACYQLDRWLRHISYTHLLFLCFLIFLLHDDFDSMCCTVYRHYDSIDTIDGFMQCQIPLLQISWLNLKHQLLLFYYFIILNELHKRIKESIYPPWLSRKCYSRKKSRLYQIKSLRTLTTLSWLIDIIFAFLYLWSCFLISSEE